MPDLPVGKVTVPNPLIGLSQEEAEAALADVYLFVAYAVAQPSALYTRGKVKAADVVEGADIDAGSTVTLTLSLGVITSSSVKPQIRIGISL